jgi:hypothetical protein
VSFELPADHPAANVWNLAADDILEQEREDLNEQGEPRSKLQKRSRATRSADLSRITALLNQGYKPDAIAGKLGLDRKTVLQDTQELSRVWRQDVSQQQESYRAMLLDKLVRLEALALESFQDSREKTITDRSSSDKGESSSTRKVFSAGDAAFLNCARESIKQQIALLGLDGKKDSVAAFDKDAFLDAVASKLAEAKLAATSVPVEADDIPMVELVSAADPDSPFT